MRAVIFSPGDWPGIAPLNETYPAPMLPLVDRPFVQHIVEYLVHQGITRFDFILSHLPEKVEHFLGDGHRWGCKFTYHLVRDAARPYRTLRTMHFEAGETVLLGHGECLPPLAGALSDTVPVRFCERTSAPTNGAEHLDWTGWALVTPEHVASLAPDVDRAGLHAHLEAARAEPRPVGRCLKVDTVAGLLAAHEAVLGKQFEGLLLAGREVMEEVADGPAVQDAAHAPKAELRPSGIWLSRNVVLHPTAELKAPVYIGENCQIGAGVTLGPHVVLGNGCVIDNHSTVTNSLVFSGSYVGEHLTPTDVIVDKNLLINVRLGGALRIEDVLGDMADDPVRRAVVHFLSRTFALTWVLLLAPLMVGTAFFLKARRRHQPVWHRSEMVRLPAGEQEMAWETFPLFSFEPPEQRPHGAHTAIAASKRDFLLRVVPGLLNAVRGEVSLVGVPPRSAEEIKALPETWQKIYRRGKAGLITEASVYCGPDAPEDAVYAAELYYIASAGWRHDLRLLRGYLGRTFCPFLYPAHPAEVDPEDTVAAGA